MLIPEIDWDLCQACTPCQARSACKTRAITQIDPDEPPYIAYERCNSCAACVLACCCGAISMINSSTASGSISIVAGKL
jgi:Fe-S-cluster-containing hydrogenase component 2